MQRARNTLDPSILFRAIVVDPNDIIEQHRSEWRLHQHVYRGVSGSDDFSRGSPYVFSLFFEFRVYASYGYRFCKRLMWKFGESAVAAELEIAGVPEGANLPTT